MYHYRFECRTKDAKGSSTRFIVEGHRYNRDECVAIHNALLSSPLIVISSAQITETVIATA